MKITKKSLIHAIVVSNELWMNLDNRPTPFVVNNENIDEVWAEVKMRNAKKIVMGDEDWNRACLSLNVDLDIITKIYNVGKYYICLSTDIEESNMVYETKGGRDYFCITETRTTYILCLESAYTGQVSGYWYLKKTEKNVNEISTLLKDIKVHGFSAIKNLIDSILYGEGWYRVCVDRKNTWIVR